MNKLLSLAVLGLLATCQAEPAVARGFSTSYGSRSYSAPSRSYTPAPTVTRNVTVNRTTVVHENSGGGAGNLVTGMMLGSMMSHANTPVIVQQPAPQVIQQQPIVEQVPVQAPAPQVVYEQAPKEESHWFLNLLILGAVGFGIFYLIGRSTNKSA